MPEPTSTATVFGTVLKTAGLAEAVEIPAHPPTFAWSEPTEASSQTRPAVAAELWPRFAKDGGKHAGGSMRTLYTDAGAKCILNTDDTLELYDLPADPGESRNLRETAPALARWAAGWLMDWAVAAIESQDGDAGVDMNAQLLQKLRALGYVQ